MLDNTNQPNGPQHYVDAAEIPKWGKASDGRNVAIHEDASLQADFAAWRQGACVHTTQFTGKTVNAIGAEVYRRYCKTCGIATTQALKHCTIANTTVTLIDADKREALIDQYISDRRDALEDLANRAANRLQPGARSAYAEYLNSAGWREKRSLVMARCGGLCEGCRKQSADDVHHLTYANKGAEFLFELVGLCRDCHTRWHEQEG